MPGDSDSLVLVVDDDPDTRSNLCDILELDDYRVETAGTVAEVLKRKDWDRISAILLDRQLPDGNAEELLPHLRQVAPEAAVLVVTGYADLQGAIAALRQGAAAHFRAVLHNQNQGHGPRHGDCSSDHRSTRRSDRC